MTNRENNAIYLHGCGHGKSSQNTVGNNNDNNHNGKHYVSCTDRIIMFMENRGRNVVSRGILYYL